MEDMAPGVVIWEHRDRGRNGHWRPYGPILNFELEHAYSATTSRTKTTIQYTCLNQTRTVNIEDMQETTEGRDPEVCELRRVVTTGPEWFWDDGITWLRYTPEAAETLERAHAAGDDSVTLAIQRWQYTVTFNEGMYFQRNLSYGTLRPVLRVDFTGMVGPCAFEVGVYEYVMNIQRTCVEGDSSSGDLSQSDDEDELLVPVDSVTNTDSCVLCLDEFDKDRPAMRLRECHGHFFHRNCDMHTNILHVIKLLGQCPVCSKSYRKGDQGLEGTSPVTPRLPSAQPF